MHGKKKTNVGAALNNQHGPETEGRNSRLKAVCESLLNALSSSCYDICSILNSVSSAARHVEGKRRGEMYTFLTQCVQNIYPLNQIYFRTRATRASDLSCIVWLIMYVILQSKLNALWAAHPGAFTCQECEYAWGTNSPGAESGGRQRRAPWAPPVPFYRRRLRCDIYKSIPLKVTSLLKPFINTAEERYGKCHTVLSMFLSII